MDNSSYSISQWIKSLNNISEMILMDKEIDITTDAILAVLNTHIGAYAALYLKVDEKGENLILHSFTRNKIIQKVLKIINFDVFLIKYPLNDPEKETHIVRCFKENKTLSAKNLSHFFYPAFPSKHFLDKVQRILGLKNCIATPVRVKEKAIGMFFAVTKKTEFSNDELELFKFYSNIAGISYENHERLKELTHKYEQEKETTSLLGHEIKTPVAIAYNNIQLLNRLLKRDGKKLELQLFNDFKKIGGKLKMTLEHVNHLCTSILSLREIENNILTVNQKLDLKHFLSQIVRTFRKQAKAKGLDFRYSCKIKPGTFYGGGSQFEQIFTILLDNAIKYTEEGYVEARIQLDGKKLQCSVKDTGIGISNKEKTKVFNRYYRVKNHSSHGLGVGLYIAKRIIDALHGNISIKNNEKLQGTEFIVTLPVYKTKIKSDTPAK